MILEMGESVGSASKPLPRNSFEIEIEDDAPKKKPSLEEVDALEVRIISHLTILRYKFIRSYGSAQ